MTAATTVVEFIPPFHVMRGFKGDAVPFDSQVFEINFPGFTVDADTWTVTAALYNREGTSIYDYSILLEDTSDDPALATTELRVTLSPISSVNSTNLGVGEFHGDIRVTPPTDDVRTVVLLRVDIKDRCHDG